MPRRSHKKSRLGCAECKRRHLKCDETKPKCINCVTAHIRCPYDAERSFSGSQGPSPETPQTGSTPASTSLSVSPADTSMTMSEATAPASGELNMLHLELLYFWSTGSYRSFLLSSAAPLLYADTCIRNGLRHPFLMQQILATSALHLSIERPDQKAHYRHHATQLQAEALAEFNTILRMLNESNIVSAFLFSSLVGLHVFCETFSSGETDFNQVLDSLISCINLLRGVRSIIAGNWWTYLLNTELKPILSMANDKRKIGEANPYPLNDLADLIAEADIGVASREAYRRAVAELETVFTEQTHVSGEGGAASANMIFAWLVTVPKEYVDLLAQRRPEALVILSYYAVLLHHRRQFWAIGDAGRFLIDGITSHLGKHWEKWLTWPKSVTVG